MKKTVKVDVRNVGQAFGCRGVVTDLSGAELAETRLFPFGFDGRARSAASDLALEKGWQVTDDE